MEYMKLNPGSNKIMTALFVMFILACLPAYAQDEGFNPDRNRAEKAFEGGDYSTALNHYKSLREKFLADPVYAYYTGACMVELRKDQGEAVKLLKEAILNSSLIRTVPDRAWYYLGRAYQQAGDFDLAVDAYDNFRETARRREIRELDIEGLIDECIAGTGQKEEDEKAGHDAGRDDEAEGKAEGIDESGRETGKKEEGDRKMEADKEKIKEVAGAEGQEESVGKEAVVMDAGADRDQEPGADYESLAREALEYQFMADSVLRLADRYRISLAEMTGPDRQSMQAKILSLEQSGFKYQREADRKYREAARLASEKYDRELLPELSKMEQELPLHGEQDGDSLRSTGKESEHEKVDEQGEPVMTDTDTTAAGTDITDSLAVINRPKPVLEVFSEQYGREGDIPLNPELPPGLFYRIQVAAFRNPKPLSFFNNLGPVSILRTEGSDVNFYFIGLFRTKQAAEKALVKVRRKGFSDAFILALMDGERISMEKAEQLEESWSDKSLLSNDTLTDRYKPEKVEPPTLVYRVRVLKAKEKIKDERLEQLERLADSRTYDVFETDAGEYVYLIGNFLTFESAAAYADLLYRNGMKEAEVAAYLGKKEIPLETAKKLFDMYFEK